MGVTKIHKELHFYNKYSFITRRIATLEYKIELSIFIKLVNGGVYISDLPTTISKTWQITNVTVIMCIQESAIT